MKLLLSLKQLVTPLRTVARLLHTVQGPVSSDVDLLLLCALLVSNEPAQNVGH